MALPATDNFTGTNGQALDVYSANWTCNDGGTGHDELEIQSNAAAPDDAGKDEGAQHWSADAFDADQYSEATIVADDQAISCIGVAVRCAAGSTLSFYGFYHGYQEAWLFKVIGGSWTQLGNATDGFDVNDLMRLEADGTTITPMINGTEEDPPGAQTDESLSSGSAGLCAYGTNANHRLDNWEGGNLAGPAFRVPRPPAAYFGGPTIF